MNVDAQPLRGPLDLDPGDAGVGQGLLDVGPHADVLMELFRIPL
jgi:hypothetical protein